MEDVFSWSVVGPNNLARVFVHADKTWGSWIWDIQVTFAPPCEVETAPGHRCL